MIRVTPARRVVFPPISELVQGADLFAGHQSVLARSGGSAQALLRWPNIPHRKTAEWVPNARLPFPDILVDYVEKNPTAVIFTQDNNSIVAREIVRQTVPEAKTRTSTRVLSASPVQAWNDCIRRISVPERAMIFLSWFCCVGYGANTSQEIFEYLQDSKAWTRKFLSMYGEDVLWTTDMQAVYLFFWRVYVAELSRDRREVLRYREVWPIGNRAKWSLTQHLAKSDGYGDWKIPILDEPIPDLLNYYLEYS